MEYIIIIILVLFSALFSGLTLGLMGLDTFELQRKMNLGNKNAAKVYPIRKKGNELLTALLLGNTAINSVLAIFLGSIASGFVAGILSTVLIFLFGEIIPQSIISRHALTFGAKSAPIVKILLFILYPITKPIAYMLDKMLGKEFPNMYSKVELQKIIQEHEDSDLSDIDDTEEKIVIGALSFSEKKAEEIMTPRTVVYMLDQEKQITSELINDIREQNFSRIPIYKDRRDNIVGILYAKDLLGISEGKISGIMNKDFIEVSENKKLDEVINEFLNKKQHIAIIRDEFNGFSGILTLEDVLEEVIGHEIMDETDDYVDLREYAKNKSKS